MNAALLADPARGGTALHADPGRTLGQPEDNGNVVVFLASAAATYMHGQILAVDGGWMTR